jgi:hypothetical protein
MMAKPHASGKQKDPVIQKKEKTIAGSNTSSQRHPGAKKSCSRWSSTALLAIKA